MNEKEISGPTKIYVDGEQYEKLMKDYPGAKKLIRGKVENLLEKFRANPFNSKIKTITIQEIKDSIDFINPNYNDSSSIPLEKEKTKDEKVTEKDLRLVYNYISGVIRYYLDIPEEITNIVTLWIMGTYRHNKFSSYPYLFINAMRGSGKTRLLKLVSALSKDGLLINSVTETALFRTIGTLCLDEFEGVGGKDKDSLRELLNSSYKKGGVVLRYKKKKTADGEDQIAEKFLPYRPIAMANIWGMEEVLGDRCILVTLEKSNDFSKTQLIENFDSINYTQERDILLRSSNESVVCDVTLLLRNIETTWNKYVKETTLNNTTTLTTHNNTKLHEDSLINSIPKFDIGDEVVYPIGFFEKVKALNIDGRNLELFMPLFMVAQSIAGEDILDATLEYAAKKVKEKKTEEMSESKDVMVYSLVAGVGNSDWVSIKELTDTFRLIVGDGENEWVNSKWLGRAIKRLNLILESKRVNTGRMVRLDYNKAKQKELMFK